MRSVLFLSIFYLSSVTQAGDWDFSESHKARCSNGSMSEMNFCLANEYEKVDKNLNKRYSELTGVLADPKLLKKSQLAWLKFRDSTCEYEASGIEESGSLYPYAHYACLIDTTEKRIKDLEKYLEWDCNGCPPR